MKVGMEDFGCRMVGLRMGGGGRTKDRGLS